MRKLYVISAIAMLAASACEKTDTAGTRVEGVILDSLVTVLAPPPGLHSLDLFIYESEGLKRLQASGRFVAGKNGIACDADGCIADSIRILLPKGDKIIAAVGDSPYGFRKEALGTYDALSQLSVLYYDEDRRRPLRSGQSFASAGDIVELSLESPLVEISLDEISQNFEGYECLESPRIYLKDAAASVEMFRETGFRPAETVSDTLGMRGLMWEPLPCDLGFYAQRPGILLKCYPNESGPVQTSVVVEGIYKGGKVSFTYAFPSLKKNCRYSLGLEIGSDPKQYDFSVNVSRMQRE